MVPDAGFVADPLSAYFAIDGEQPRTQPRRFLNRRRRFESSRGRPKDSVSRADVRSTSDPRSNRWPPRSVNSLRDWEGWGKEPCRSAASLLTRQRVACPEHGGPCSSALQRCLTAWSWGSRSSVSLDSSMGGSQAIGRTKRFYFLGLTVSTLCGSVDDVGHLRNWARGFARIRFLQREQVSGRGVWVL